MKNIFSCFIIIMPLCLIAQIQDYSVPYSFSKNNIISTLNVIKISDFNKKDLLQSDKSYANIKPYAFAKGFDCDIDFKNVHTIVAGDVQIKLLKICATDAEGFAFSFNNFDFTSNEKLYIFSSDRSHIIGAFTAINNKKDGFLSTGFIPGDTVIIEYQLPVNKRHNKLKINTVAVAYRSLYDKSEWCEIDINCDTSTVWQTVKRAVVRIVYEELDSKSYYTCTGTLVANTCFDDKPYILTANHCVNSTFEAKSAVFIFNYEKSLCNGIKANSSQMISGSELLATAENKLDFSLLQMSAVPPKEYEPYFSGWNLTKNYENTSVCIHHPGGDVKKISKDFDKLAIGTFYGYGNNKHWKILSWDTGTTEGGSSGAGLFDSQGLLIGTLSGGDASCDNKTFDLFQQFYHEWDDIKAHDQQLAHWLDPHYIKPDKISGYDPYKNQNIPIPVNFDVVLTNDIAAISWQAPTDKPDKYLIYKNLEPFKEVKTPQIILDTLNKTGVYLYYATAVFSEKESPISTQKTVVFGDTTAIPVTTDIKIFPNPTKKHINIYTPDSVFINKIEIFTQNGKKIFIENINKKRYAFLNLTNITAGLYIVKIYTTKQTYVEKIIFKPE